MSPLTPEQQAELLRHLEQMPRLTPPLKEELLDHLCCAVETQLAQGVPFAEALARVQGLMNENEVDQIIHSLPKNRSTMINVLLGSLTLILAGLLFTWPAASPTLPEAELPALTFTTPMVVDWAPPSHCPMGTGCATDHQTSGFGMRIHPVTKTEVQHRGIDWKAPLGTPVYAAGAGRVTEAGERGMYGNYIRIAHDDIYETAYAHLSEILVAAGDTIMAGQLIGKVGNSGASMGSHLHYEVIKNGEKINPMNFFFNDLTPEEYEKVIELSSQSNQSFD
jgi:murein DD-endopeptidase MepM/ murein hydrolase activator NlpD